MKKTTLTSLSIVLAAGLLVGCGGGGGGINSGVDQAKPANEVTDDEAERICEASADYLATQLDTTDLNCRLPGIVAAVLEAAGGGEDADMQEACQDAYDQCVEDAPEPEETDCSDATAETSGCDDTVTVGEVETCLTDTVDAGAEAADQIPSCSEVTMDTLEELAEMAGEEPTVEQPASCETVVEACPGLSGLGG